MYKYMYMSNFYTNRIRSYYIAGTLYVYLAYSQHMASIYIYSWCNIYTYIQLVSI